jgi:hypothetical protein
MNRFFPAIFCLLPLCACTTVHPKLMVATTTSTGSRPVPEKPPYEKHHRWKDWSVWVRELPVLPGHMVWYEVQAGRVSNGKEDVVRRATYDSDGEIRQTWMGDLKGNGWPVLILFISDTGKGRYGFLRLIECRGDGFRVLQGPNTPRKLLEGYRGSDAWDWKEGELIREFPLYREGDEPGEPRGGESTIGYKWIKGKWRVRFHREPPLTPPENSALVE